MRRRITPAERRKARGLRPSRAAEQSYVRTLRGVLRGVGEALLRDAKKIVDARADSLREDAPTLRPTASMMGSVGRAVGEAHATMARAVKLSGRAGLKAFGVSTFAGESKLEKAVNRSRLENVKLIRDASDNLRSQIAEVLREAGPGIRWEEVAPALSERLDVGESAAERIARDQTLKTNADVLRIHQEEAGITAYLWSTSQDERVRDEHQALEGEEIDWDSPPDVGHPGEDINCRCVPIPVMPEQA